MQADYIIIGAGSAGCMPAYRLTEDPGTKVLLIEAGGRDWNPLIHVPAGFTPKRLQGFLGHSSIKMTYDTYGHLFPSLEDDHEKFTRIEREIGVVA